MAKNAPAPGAAARRAASDDPFAPFLGHPDFVLSLARGLRVIEAFGAPSDGVSVADLAARTELSRAAVRRILVTLQMLGYAEACGRGFRLEPRVLRLGTTYLASNSAVQVAQAAADEITGRAEESSSVCVLDGDELILIARATVARLLSPRWAVGSRLPAYCTAAGRVLLSGFDADELRAYLTRVRPVRLTPFTVVERRALSRAIARIRLEGHAIVDQELEVGLRTIAVPVRNAAGRMVAAVNIGVYAARTSVSDLKRFLPILREQAEVLGRLMG